MGSSILKKLRKTDMKQFSFVLICSLFALKLVAQDHRLYWKYKDFDGAISVTVPGWVIHAGSWFLDEKEDRQMIRRVHKARVLVFEEANNPISVRDMQRFHKRAKKRRLEEMLSVRAKGTRVQVWARERKNALRKVVVLVHEAETFALVSLRGKLRFDEIGKLLDRIPKEHKGDGDGDGRLLPENVRSVIRI